MEGQDPRGANAFAKVTSTPDTNEYVGIPFGQSRQPQDTQEYFFA